MGKLDAPEVEQLRKRIVIIILIFHTSKKLSCDHLRQQALCSWSQSSRLSCSPSLSPSLTLGAEGLFSLYLAYATYSASSLTPTLGTGELLTALTLKGAQDGMNHGSGWAERPPWVLAQYQAIAK